MAVRKANAIWEGKLKEGQGTISLGVSSLEVPYGFASRFEDGSGSNPEELIGGAHAGCFSMAFAHQLGEAGYAPVKIETTATVHLEKSGEGFAIPKVELNTQADVPGIDNGEFQQIAEDAKQNCPVSKLLSAAEITLKADLLGG